jgi:ATP-dependent Lon protease
MSEKISPFDLKRLQLRGIKLKYRHYLLTVYEKLNSLNFIKTNTTWVSIFESLINSNTKNISKYSNELLVLEENLDAEDKVEVYTYILGLVHQEVLNDFLTFVKNEKKKKFKKFLKKLIEECDKYLQNVNNLLNENNINIDNLIEVDIANNLINSFSNNANEVVNSKQVMYYVDGNNNEELQKILENSGILEFCNYEDEDEHDNYADDENDDDYVYDDEDDGDGHEDYQKYEKSKRSNKIEKNFIDLIKARDKKPTTLVEEFKRLKNDDQKNIVKDLTDINASLEDTNNLQMRVLKSKLNVHEKKELLSRIEVQGSERKGKFKEYCESVLSFPFQKYAKMHTDNLTEPEEIKSLLSKAKNTLDEAIYGHNEAKHTILSHISQMITNPDSSGKALGLVGSKGTGKTSLVEHGFCKILGLPFVMIGLAGLTDGTYFSGHHYTYEGSQPGKIVEGLKKANVLNPVFFCDELDKVSETDRGKEISNKLIQMIDPAQNNHFQDTYFGNIDIDLSKAMWIFTWNDSDKIDPILLDRIKIIKVKGFNLDQKMVISRNYLLPKIIKDIGIKHGININDEVIKYLIDSLTFEGGVRKLKELLFEIVSEYNMKTLTAEIQPPPKKKRRLLLEDKPFEITMENVNNFLIKKIPYEHIKIKDQDLIGNIVGLYATANDVGGIIPISAKLIPSDVTLSLNLTGNLGKIMKESAIIAKTVAWDKTPQETKDKLMDKWKIRKEGIHIHCSEGSGLNIKKDIGITGEIDLTGKVMKIGGLQQKMYGAKNAGCKLVLFPEGNIKDYEQAVEDCPKLIDDTFKAIPVGTFSEALEHLIV